MTNLFLKIINMSISATYLVLAVLLLRLLLKKAPKWIHVLLWGLVAVRLLCPFTLESAMSLIPSTEVISPEIMMDVTPTGIEAVNNVVNPIITESFAPAPIASANPLQIWIPVFSILWCSGMALMALYTLFTYLRLRHRVSTAIRVKDNLYISEYVASPFVLGIFRPRIYLPYHMSDLDRYHVIAHERAHIRRRDHWWKPLGFLLLTIHWFNPIMWLAYILLCRDIELACDEKVIQELGPDQRADYSQALLHCSISHRSIAACPIAFGEVGVKERVRNVLNYKKPAFWVIVVCLALVAIVSVCFLTDPPEEPERLPGYHLIEQVVNQQGYTITGQENMIVNLVLEKDKLPEDCFTKKGHTFEVNEVIPYETGVFYDNRIYLHRAALDEEDPTYVRFTFAFQTDGLSRNALLLPYHVDIEGNGFVCDVSWRSEVWDNQTTYSQSADGEPVMLFEPVMNGEGFCVLVKADICRQAGHHIAFMLKNMNRLTYEETKPTPPVSITLDNVSSTGLTMLFHQDQSAIDGPLKTSNDYFLEKEENGQWLAVPYLMQPKFMEGALDVSTLHHYGIDWTGVYGRLSDGRYRVAKPVPLSSSPDSERVVLYAEFTIDEHDIYLSVESASTTGMALSIYPDNDTLLREQITTDLLFQLESYDHNTCKWSPVEPTKAPELSVAPGRTIRVLPDTAQENTRVNLDWSECYGELPMGRYRAVTKFFIHSEPHTYYAEFYPGSSVYAAAETTPAYPAASATDFSLPECYAFADDTTAAIVHTESGQTVGGITDTELDAAHLEEPDMLSISRYLDSLDPRCEWLSMNADGYKAVSVAITDPQTNIRTESSHAIFAHNGQCYDLWFDNDVISGKEKENIRKAVMGVGHISLGTVTVRAEPQLTIPDTKEISLEVEGSTFYVLVDEDAVQTLETLFAEGTAMGFEPKTYFPGPQMVFHGKDGSKTTITLDLDSDMFIHEGVFYDYGRPGYPDLEKVFILMRMVYWPEAVTEHPSFQWYFDQILEPVSDEALPGVWRGNIDSDGAYMFPEGQFYVQFEFHKYGKGQYSFHTDGIDSIGIFSYRIEDGTLHMNLYGDEMYAIPYRIEDGFLYLTMSGREVPLFTATEVAQFARSQQTDPQLEATRIQRLLKILNDQEST
ncbi:MAG: M56 family metallopeptidase [Oscillospiraceae bacterium]|nr:M56 family metallopeptidase [Oscillospiraceae bacterium]